MNSHEAFEKIWPMVQMVQLHQSLAEALTEKSVAAMLDFQHNRAAVNDDYIVPVSVEHYLTFIVDEVELQSSQVYYDLLNSQSMAAAREEMQNRLLVIAEYALLAAAMMDMFVLPAPVATCFGEGAGRNG